MVLQMTTFSHYLLEIRIAAGLTQQAFIDKLVDYDETFFKLDLTTFSRWERGITTPPLTKQILIFRCLGLNIDKLIVDIEKEFIPKLSHILMRRIDPYSVSPQKTSLNLISNIRELHEIKVRIHQFHIDYLKLNIDLEKLHQNKNISTISISDPFKHLIGHILYGYIEANLSCSDISLSNVEQLSFINEHDINRKKTIFYIISSYSATSGARIETLSKIITTIKNNPNLKSFCITVQYQEVFDFFSSICKLEIVSKGESIKFGGVKIYNKNYRFVQVYIKSENILASKYILGLLNKL